MNNNNYIAWLYIRGIPEYIARARTILHLSYGRVQYGPSLSNYSGIPLIAMQYNINIGCNNRKRATLSCLRSVCFIRRLLVFLPNYVVVREHY